MDNGNDLVYFVNSQGRAVYLSSPNNEQYWELRGRKGFTAPEVEIFTEKMSNGVTRYFGNALKPRIASLRMVCVGKSTAERDKVFFDMVDTLMDMNGTGEGKLYLKRSNGETVYMNCVYSGGMNIIEQYKRLNLFDVEFYAADPLYYFRRYAISFYDIINAPQKKITVRNPHQTPMMVSMMIATFNPDYVLAWSADGYIENETTGEKITFNDSEVDEDYQLYLSLNPRQSACYLETETGEKSIGSYLVDWTGTDQDFFIVPGDNVISFANFAGSQRVNRCSTLFIDATYLGV